MFVKEELRKLGIPYTSIDLGEIEIPAEISSDQRELLKVNLLKSGLELMDDSRAILIERIKNVIVEMIHYADELPKIKNSIYISEKLNHDYTYLANLFSESTGTNI